MDYSNFYIISDKHSRGALNLAPAKNLDFYKIFRNECNQKDDLPFILYKGSKATDLINSGIAGVYLISEKFQQVLSSQRLSGWASMSTSIKGYENLNYRLLTVEGRCSAIDLSKSKNFIKEPYSDKGKAIAAKRGLFFDLDSWDGSDVFTPENSKFILVTKRVKELLSAHKLTNLEIERITDFELI